jgi:hypothetical protein
VRVGVSRVEIQPQRAEQRYGKEDKEEKDKDEEEVNPMRASSGPCSVPARPHTEAHAKAALKRKSGIGI